MGCQRYSNGTLCFTFATKKKIVWKNDQNPKGLKLRKELKHGRNHVAQLIKDAGYYNGDITLLRGYQTEVLTPSKSSSNIVTKKVEKKKDNYDYPSLIAKQRSVHKSNWKDYVDYNNKYKAFVMAITKTKNDMTFGWETDDTSWGDVIKKAFDRCNKYLKQKPKNYPKDSICILYYKGITPTTDKEKIETAQKYYSQAEVERFFEKYPYILNDSNNSLLRKSKITKKITQSNDDIVSKLKDLKELLDSGVLTKDEFEKAKKKLLN